MTAGGTIIHSLRRSVLFLGLAVFLSHSSKTVHAQRHDVCASDVQCLNEGKCQLVDHAETDVNIDGNIDGDQHRHCVCKPEFGGSRCEKFCPLNCLNGGYCRFNSDKSTMSYHERFDANPLDYSCECFGYFKGTFCEIPYENCSDGRQCFHGGQCTAAKSKKKTACACPEGFSGGNCAVDLSMVKLGRASSSSNKSNRAGPIVAGIFVPIIAIALIYAVVVYRRRRKYSALVGKTVEFDVAELAPRSSGRNSGRQQEWRNII